ncbi:hypothetical protein [Amycolatopsis echigonensis]|uniref:Uncharacterized protein n=1 Tax=Amycolatopsis echigonensis TaxID=2576905 RepID=A0A8E1VXQ0_9PSEU|nr:hypothetical protein [Amycolatopsis echigonensis]MBB2500261.1 hypothetical protein [Amycolatopsis echigonensis]
MLDLHITDDHGFDRIITVKPRQLLVFERLTGIPFSKMEDDGVSMAQLYQLAHIAMRVHHSETPAELAEFELRYDVMPVGDGETDASDPGRAAA